MRISEVCSLCIEDIDFAEESVRVLQETLGHESIQTTQIYAHTDKKEQRKAYQSFPLASGM